MRFQLISANRPDIKQISKEQNTMDSCHFCPGKDTYFELKYDLCQHVRCQFWLFLN